MASFHLRIKHKVLFGFLGAVLVFGGATTVSHLSLNSMGATIDTVVKQRQPALLSLEEARAAILQAAGSLGNFVITQDRGFSDAFSASLDQAWNQLREYNRYNASSALPEFEAKIDTLRHSGKQVFTAASGFDTNYPGIAYANSDINPLTRSMLQNVNDMLRIEREASGFDAELRLERALAMADLRYAISSMMRGIRGYLAFRNPTEKQNIGLFADQAEARIATLSSSEDDLSFEQVDYLSQVRDAFPTLKTRLERMYAIHDADSWRSDAWLMRQEVLPLLLEITDRLNSMASSEIERIRLASEQLVVRAQQTNNLVLWITLVGTLVAGLIGWFVARIITRRLNSASCAMHQVAAGDGDLTRRIDIQHADEVGDLASNFNAFVSRVQELVRATAGATTSVIQSVAETNDRAGRIADRILQQQAESDQVAAAVTEMSASISEVSRSAQNANNASQTAAQAADAGQAEVELTTREIQNIAQRLESGMSLVATLDSDSQAIGGVLDVINGIAEQTNLLALNAAIEAARAGEQGRGFAVVADEVRTLASRTHDSTGEIEAMISRLRESALKVSELMLQGKTLSEANCAQAQKANASLSEIARAVSDISQLNNQIATAAEQQRVVAEDISRAVESVSARGKENAEEAAHTKQTTERLGDLASDLQSLIGRFKLAGGDDFDFEAAKSAHLAWRAQIRSFLDGKGSLDQSEAVSHHDCVLGKWYYSEESSRFRHLDSMQALERPHQQLHTLIREIIALKQAHKAQEAEQKYQALDSLSGEIVDHLEILQREALEGKTAHGA